MYYRSYTVLCNGIVGLKYMYILFFYGVYKRNFWSHAAPAITRSNIHYLVVVQHFFIVQKSKIRSDVTYATKSTAIRLKAFWLFSLSLSLSSSVTQHRHTYNFFFIYLTESRYRKGNALIGCIYSMMRCWCVGWRQRRLIAPTAVSSSISS